MSTPGSSHLRGGVLPVLLMLALLASVAQAAEGKKPRPIAVPVAPAPKATPPAMDPQAIESRIAIMKLRLHTLRLSLEDIESDTTLNSQIRVRKLLQAQIEMNKDEEQLSRLEGQVAALPGSQLPDLTGLNPDSLASRLAQVLERADQGLQRLGQGRENPPAPARVGLHEWVHVAPLPSAKERTFEQIIPVPASTERLALIHRFGDVRVDSGAVGQVRLRGAVLVQGTMSDAEATALADSVRVESTSGTTLTLAARIPSLKGRNDQAIRVDLSVEVPPDIEVTIQNSYGDVTLQGLRGRVDASVNFGDMTASQLAGPAHLAARTGDLKVEGVRGPLALENQSGALTVRDVDGLISVDGQNSDISVKSVRGGGQLTGRFGSITLQGASGDFAVNSQSASVLVEGLTGVLNLITQFGQARVNQLAGPLTAQCTSTTLGTSFVAQGQDIQARFGSVNVEFPGGNVRVVGESTPIVLRLPEAGSAQRYEATARYGSLTLQVPVRSSVAIQASSNLGTIYSDFPLRRNDAGQWQRGEAVLGSGAAQMLLQAISSSIRISRVGH